jgi:hypothetical protein
VTFPTVMNVLTLLVALDLLIPTERRLWGASIFLMYYAAASFVVFLGLAARNLYNQTLDKEFENEYESINHS